MPEVYIPTWQEFKDNHGRPVYCDNPELRGHRLWIFPTGAVSDGQRYFAEPPEDPLKRLELVQAHFQTRLENEQREFISFKKHVFEQAQMSRKFSNVPGPPATAAEDLKRGKARMEAIQEKLETIKEKIDALTHRSEQLEKADRERAARGQAADQAIQAINQTML